MAIPPNILYVRDFGHIFEEIFLIWYLKQENVYRLYGFLPTDFTGKCESGPNI